MKRNRCQCLLYLAIFVLLIGFTGQSALAQAGSGDLNTKLQSGQYILKVENFMVILDTSASMMEAYKGNAKINLAKGFISRMNQALPDLRISGALRTFGFVQLFSTEKTALLYVLKAYKRGAYGESLQAVNWAAGDSPMAVGMDAASDDLKATTGRIAVIIVSDWDELGSAPAAAAEKMKAQFGDRLCIYPVMVGDDAEGKKLMAKVARAGRCGFDTDAGKIVTAADMDNFVERVFFTAAKAGPVDSDRDGVVDSLDKCPGTPAGVAVDKDGCPLDSDKDGVYDYLDKCPGTPAGVKVDKDGCPWPKDISITLKIEFDTNKSNIKAKYNDEIKQVADFMKTHPKTKAVIQGHTDNIGKEAANVKLSQSRADSVKAYLVDKFGIGIERLQAVGYGPNKPIASNATEEGRQKNRRVEAVFGAMK